MSLDTNLIIYAFDPAAGSKSALARRILKAAAVAELVLPLQVLNESFAVLTGRFAWPRKQARDALDELATDVAIAAPSVELSWKAMRLADPHGLSFWNALIVAGAAEAGCSLLLTEDLQDGREFGAADVGRAIRILNPFSETNAATLSALGFIDE
ncbi:MAG: PIN domain-containing protein [Vulcanimicrobiaceae bacterium]